MNTKQLRTLYDRGYFHGVNSGYPSEGYALCHPHFSHWIDYVQRVRPGADRWLDIGCAYGFLVEEARQKGLSAFGVDISSFALGQNAAVHDYVAESVAERLPFASETFDVVTILDVIEHVASPETVFHEIVRILRPGGLCLLTTPDPIFFERTEETHLSEKPPSFWVDLCQSSGMKVAFRFAGEPFNLELVAVRPRDAEDPEDPALASFQHDDLRPYHDIVSVDSQLTETLRCAYRRGWNTLESGEPSRRRIMGEEASLYLLNTGRAPLSLSVSLSIALRDTHGSIRVQIDDRPLNVLQLENVDDVRRFVLDPFLLSAGGHHLRLFPGHDLPPISISEIQITGHEVPAETLTRSFPFDLYQRYQTAAHIVRLATAGDGKDPGDVRVLDLGGVMGGSYGHMGSLADFLPGHRVITADVRLCDIPNAVMLTNESMTTRPQSTDVVVCLDVLEHIPPERRTAFLDHLLSIPRAWLILACPCSDPAISQAEVVLDEFIKCKSGYQHDFIQEHLRFGLPSADNIANHFKSRGKEFVCLPNGYLHRWLFMQCVTFFVSSMQSSRLLESISHYYNEQFYSSDNCEPSYRKVFVVNVGAAGRLATVDLSSVCVAEDRGVSGDWATRVTLLLQLINLQDQEKKEREIGRLSFLLSEREKHIADLLKHAANLQEIDRHRQGHIRNLELEIEDLRKHSENLLRERDDLGRHAANLERERADLQNHLLETTETVHQRDRSLGELRERVIQLENDKLDLLRRANDLELDRIDIQKRALSRDKQILELEAKTSDLTASLARAGTEDRDLRQAVHDLKAENEKLRELLAGRKPTDFWKLIREHLRRSVK